jgi:hypothetical protein
VPPRAFILAVLLLLNGGCAPTTPGAASFHGPDPASRMAALTEAAQRGDRLAVPQIVEMLDDADPAVRLLAGGTLQKLTGLTHGYDASAPRYQRLEAQARWRQWVRSGGMTAGGGGGANDGAREKTRDGLKGASPSMDGTR